MRLSSNLRRYRWAVFAAWLLLLVPSIYLAMNQSGNLTGGGFEVEGSQSLHVQRELEQHFPDQGASPLALVAAPRADASFDDMTAAVAQLERIAAEVPSVKVVPNPQQPPPQPDRPYVVTLQLDFNNTGAVDVAKQLRQKVGINGDQPGEIENGKVKLYVIGQGALGAAATLGHQARHRAGRAVEPSDRPDCFARGVRVAGGGGDAAGAGHLHRRGDHGAGLSAVDVHDDVGVRHVDGVDVRHRTGHRLFTIYSYAVPRGTARRP